MFIPKIYTVESVTNGHPDKVCDQISDAILDACLKQDPFSRVAMESFGAHGKLFLGGEVTTSAKADFSQIARHVYRDIGYTDDLDIHIAVVQQSPDIAQGVDTGGAGDQGIMHGFATGETEQMLPRGVVLAHQLAKKLETLRTDGGHTWLRPDGKTQVTMHGNRVESIVVSAQHDPNITLSEMRQKIRDFVIRPLVDDITDIRLFINPAGAWNIGGFAADTGLTGRKIMVDTYGGLIPHGGGAFSGKDATKVDRSAAYMCRLAAKTLVALQYAQAALVSVGYAIGEIDPVMVVAHDQDGRDLTPEVIKRFDFRPSAIIERLGLRQPIFQPTAAYGHFSQNSFPWEKV